MVRSYCYSLLIFMTWLWSASGQANETLRACQSVITCFNDAQNEMDRCLAILVGEKPPQIAIPGQSPPVAEATPRPKAADPDDCMRDVKDKIKQRRLMDKAKLQDFQGCLSSKIESGTEDVDPRKYRYCATVTGRYVNKTTEISRRQKRQAVKSSAAPTVEDKPGPSSTAKPALVPAALSTPSPPTTDMVGLSRINDNGTTFLLIDSSVTPKSAPLSFNTRPSESAASTLTPAVLNVVPKDGENGSQSEIEDNLESASQPVTLAKSGNPSTQTPKNIASTAAPVTEEQKEKTETLEHEQITSESTPAEANKAATIAGRSASDRSATESPVAQEITLSKSDTSTTELPSTAGSSITSQKVPVPPTLNTPQPQPAAGLRIEAPGVASRPGAAPVAVQFPNSSNAVEKTKNAATNVEPTPAVASIQENIENPPSQISLETQQRNRAEILREARRRLSEFKGCMARARIKREECKPLVRCCPDAATCYLGYELSDLHNKVHKLERELLQGRQDCVHKKRTLNRDELADALDQIDAEELISDDSVVSQVIF